MGTTVVLSILGSILCIIGRRYSLLFLCAGAAGLLVLVLTIYLLLSIDITVIAMALSAIVLFVAVKIVSKIKS